MSMFCCCFTVQKKKVLECPNNSDASKDLEIVKIQPAVRMLGPTFQAKNAFPSAMSNIMQWNRLLGAW